MTERKGRKLWDAEKVATQEGDPDAVMLKRFGKG